MPDLVRIELPGLGSGFMLRRRSPWGMERVEFLGSGRRVWLFPTVSGLRESLASAGPVAARWRGLLPAGGQELDDRKVELYDLRKMVGGSLRWGPGDAAWPCTELCVEMAFFCEEEQLLHALGPPHSPTTSMCAPTYADGDASFPWSTRWSGSGTKVTSRPPDRDHWDER